MRKTLLSEWPRAGLLVLFVACSSEPVTYGPGDVGTPGDNGTAGDDGMAGDNGTAGDDGMAGDNGTSGDNGMAGDSRGDVVGDASIACDPLARPLVNEGLVEESFDDRCPDGMALAGTVCVDRFEAALVEVDTGGNLISSWSPYVNPGTTLVRAVSIAGAVPQGYINADQAEAACNRAGKRLCTDAEWLRACRGSGDTIYPYGDIREAGVCNDARAIHPAVEYFGTDDPWIWSELGNGCINQIPDALAPAGVHPDCVSEEGLFDLMGNLHEWTADPNGTFRGGFYVDTVLNGDGCLYVTTAHARAHWDYSTGFRCCAEPR